MKSWLVKNAIDIYSTFNIYSLLKDSLELSGPELDLRPEFNSGFPGLNLGRRFKLDPTWVFLKCILENMKTFSINADVREKEERLSYS